MAYVHLADGSTKHLNEDEYTKAFGDEPPRVYRNSGKEHMVVGVYPDEVEYEMTPEEKTVKREKKQAKKDKRDRKENPDTNPADEKVVSE